MLLPSLGKGLARKTSAYHIMARYRGDVEFANVSAGLQIEIPFVEAGEVFVDFTSEYTVMTKVSKCQVKAAEPREEVDKTQSRCERCRSRHTPC